MPNFTSPHVLGLIQDYNVLTKGIKTKNPNPEASGLFGFCGTSSPDSSGEPGIRFIFFWIEYLSE
jgi:hypothetical protein